MKILHIIGGDLDTGAGRGGYWLHKGLRNISVDSRILTNSARIVDDDYISYTAQTRWQKGQNILRGQLEALPVRLYGRGNSIFFSTGITGFDFTSTNEYRDADIVHLHWINRGLVNIKHLSKVNKPMVWTMRDLWPMTGGCHYDIECKNYLSGCGRCPQLLSTTSFDLSRCIWRRKKRYLPQTIKMVGISRWISEQAKESLLLRHFDIRMISNNVSTSDFFPIEKDTARAVMGLKTDKKIILAGAHTLKWFYKGFSKLLDALKKLDQKRYYLVFMGHLDSSVIKNLGFEYQTLGFLRDDLSMRIVYSAADVFVAPSIVDAFGKTIAEAMACGTPAVCFDATGPKDIVDHRTNGYKATPFDAEDLASGIDWITSAEHYPELCRNARDKVVRSFDSVVIAKQYRQLYEEILSK